MERTYTLKELPEIVDILSSLMKQCSVFTFIGPLGAGKTTLIKRFLAHHGVQDLVTSPTFTYLNQYTNNGQTFYHFDLYRLHTLQDFQEAGFDEYLYQPDALTLIEWPEIVMPLLTHNVCHIVLDYSSEEARSIEIKKGGA